MFDTATPRRDYSAVGQGLSRSPKTGGLAEQLQDIIAEVALEAVESIRKDLCEPGGKLHERIANSVAQLSRGEAAGLSMPRDANTLDLSYKFVPTHRAAANAQRPRPMADRTYDWSSSRFANPQGRAQRLAIESMSLTGDGSDDDLAFVQDVEAEKELVVSSKPSRKDRARESKAVMMTMRAEAKGLPPPLGEQYDPAHRLERERKAQEFREAKLARMPVQSKMKSSQLQSPTARIPDAKLEDTGKPWVVTVQVLSATGLRKEDERRETAITGIGSVDPFCEVEVSGKEASRWRTSTLKRTSTPQWNEEHRFVMYEPGDDLEFTLMDWDLISSQGTLLGHGMLFSADFHKKNGFEGEIELHDTGTSDGVLKVRVNVSPATDADRVEMKRQLEAVQPKRKAHGFREQAADPAREAEQKKKEEEDLRKRRQEEEELQSKLEARRKLEEERRSAEQAASAAAAAAKRREEEEAAAAAARKVEEAEARRKAQEEAEEARRRAAAEEELRRQEAAVEPAAAAAAPQDQEEDDEAY